MGDEDAASEYDIRVGRQPRPAQVPTAAPEAYGPSGVSVSHGSAVDGHLVHELVQPDVPSAGMNVWMACYTRDAILGPNCLLIAFLLYVPPTAKQKVKGAVMCFALFT